MTIIDAILFVCVVFVYLAIVNAVEFLLGTIIAFVFIAIKKNLLQSTRLMVNLQAFLNILLSSILLFVYFRYQLWTNSQIYLWSNPVLFLILYINAVYGIRATVSPNPLLRRFTTAVWVSLIPMIIIVLIGVYNNQLIVLWVIKWGIAVSIGIPVLGTVIQIRKAPLELEKFENLENRQKQIAEKINTLSHIVNVIGDMGEAKDLANVSSELNKRYSKADNLLRQGKFSDAENLIIQSEIDVNQIEESLRNRIRYSLKEEIRSRLEQARSDIQRLHKEFEMALISTEQIDELDSKIQEHLSIIDSSVFSSEKISEQLEPFERVISSIGDIKTGLRLRRNVGSQLDIIQKEIDNSQLIIDIASNLRLETIDSQLAKKQASDLLTDFQKKELMSAQELINLYRNLQSNLTKFRESIAILKANIDRNWIWNETASGQFISCVPKYCRTDTSKNGVLVLKKEGTLQNINVYIDGTLIDFETDRNMVMSTQTDYDYVISSFNFVGKRPGRGIVKLRSNELKELQNIIFPVRIIPTVTELAGNSFLFGASFGALVLIILWQLGYEPKEYSSLAVAIGTALSLFLFVIRYINISKYK